MFGVESDTVTVLLWCCDTMTAFLASHLFSGHTCDLAPVLQHSEAAFQGVQCTCDVCLRLGFNPTNLASPSWSSLLGEFGLSDIAAVSP